MNSRLDLVDRLRKMLAKARITDEQLDGGARLTDTAIRKAAAALGIDASEMPLLLRALVQRIRDEGRRFDTMTEELGAPIARFSFEPDALGNVTVRDSRSGSEKFVSGTPARALLNRLKGSSPEQQQQIMAAFAQQNGGLNEGPEINPTRKRAMTADQEDQAAEIEHHAALERTGFYGKQGAGCLIIAQDTGRVLLMHRSRSVEQPGTWGNCGGAVDEGVSPAKHALQETYEESGYTGEVVAQIPLYVFEKGSFRYSNFLAVVPQEFEPSLNWESQGSKWCTVGDWPTPLHFGLQALFGDPASMDKIERVAAAATGGAVQEGATGILDEDADVEPAILDEEEDFHTEIRRTAGTFNFPWKADGEHGFGTASFQTSKTGKLGITVMSVTDARGKPIEPGPDLTSVIQSQAEEFIGHE